MIRQVLPHELPSYNPGRPVLLPWLRRVLIQHILYFDIGEPSRTVQRFPGGLPGYLKYGLAEGRRPAGIVELSAVEDRRFLRVRYLPGRITEDDLLSWLRRVFG